MSRQKSYKEVEVIEKATELFWRNGYESTSMSSLEKAMGINRFSIYSSFGSKQGVFLESLKCYKNKLQPLLIALKKSSNGKEAIKQFFYNFLIFSRENDSGKGCLLTSTSGELGARGDAIIRMKILDFTEKLKAIFAEKLASDTHKSKELINKQANYLLIAKQGLSNASKIFDQKDLEDFIETTFENI